MTLRRRSSWPGAKNGLPRWGGSPFGVRRISKSGDESPHSKKAIRPISTNSGAGKMALPQVGHRWGGPTRSVVVDGCAPAEAMSRDQCTSREGTLGGRWQMIEIHAVVAWFPNHATDVWTVSRQSLPALHILLRPAQCLSSGSVRRPATTGSVARSGDRPQRGRWLGRETGHNAGWQMANRIRSRALRVERARFQFAVASGGRSRYV
jgi:hypothetical protein